MLELVIAVISFALGYGVREVISRRRRAEDRRRWTADHSF
jgi:hypothetical protein